MASCFENRKNPRLSIFCDFCHFKPINNTPYDEKYIEAIYLSSYQFVSEQSRKGIDLKINMLQQADYYPVIRCQDLLDKKIYPLLDEQSRKELTQKMYTLAFTDPSSANKDGIVDFDLLMLKVINLVKTNKDNNREYYKALFLAFNLG
jgi:hypothetical protein